MSTLLDRAAKGFQMNGVFRGLFADLCAAEGALPCASEEWNGPPQFTLQTPRGYERCLCVCKWCPGLR